MINSSTELENLHVSPPDAKPMLCSRCGFSAENFNRSKVFCSFLWGGKKYLIKYFVFTK